MDFVELGSSILMDGIRNRPGNVPAIRIIARNTRGCGGTGRRAGFRIPFRKECRFESCHPHTGQKLRYSCWPVISRKTPQAPAQSRLVALRVESPAPTLRGDSLVTAALLQRAGRCRYRFFEVVLGHLQVVSGRHFLRVADPGTDHVTWKGLFQLGLASRPEVLKQLRPRLKAGPLDDSQQLRSQVAVRSAVSGDDVLCPRFGQFEALIEEWPEFGEQRNHARALAVVRRLGARDVDSLAIPVDVRPDEQEML